MFSGITQTIAEIINLIEIAGCKQFTIKPKLTFSDLEIGESIALNGVCLTVTSFTADTFNVTAVPETLRLTNLNNLKLNDSVNLERSLRFNDRLGGHLVQGHVDTTATIANIESDAKSNALLVTFKIPENLARYIIKKGFIAIDGMSITIVDVGPTWFIVTFIPHTQEVSNVKHYHVGTVVNIEVDMMAKYAEKILGFHASLDTHATGS